MRQDPAAVPDLAGLADMAPELAAVFVSVAGDLALVIGVDGLIRHVALGAVFSRRGTALQVGQHLADALCRDSRAKVHALLADVGGAGVSRAREVNLHGTDGPGRDLPLSLSAIRLGAQGPVLAVGRDLSATVLVQQRLLAAQQALEREHWQQRQREARYRVLFQVATDAVLVVDADNHRIVEANRAAGELFGTPPQALAGQPLLSGLAAASRLPVEQLLNHVRHSGQPAEVRAWVGGALPAERAALVELALSPMWRADAHAGEYLLLVRARLRDARAELAARRLADLVEHMPDGLAVVDTQGQVLMANPALWMMCPGCPGAESQLIGRPLGELLGDPLNGLDELLAQVRRHGVASQVGVLLGREAAALAVEVSAALLADGERDSIGLILRRRPVSETGALPSAALWSAAVDQLAAQLGRVALPELVQAASQLSERHLIRAALLRAHGDVEQAAADLAIPPDALRQRLQRHGLPDGPTLRDSHSDSGAPPPSLLN